MKTVRLLSILGLACFPFSGFSQPEPVRTIVLPEPQDAQLSSNAVQGNGDEIGLYKCVLHERLVSCYFVSLLSG